MHAVLGLRLKRGRQARRVNSSDLAVFWRVRNHLVRQPNSAAHYTPRVARGSLIAKASHPELEYHFLQRGNAMDVVWDIVVSIGHAIEQVLVYVETHHWIFGFLAGGYIFYLHDRGLHARFDALDRRIDEIRKRLAVEFDRLG
jgi:hypothetical protein